MTLWSRLFPPPPPAPPAVTGPFLEELRTVIDPELGIDVVSLGLIRDVQVEGDRVIVRMTLTTEGCPMGPVLVDEVAAAIERTGHVAQVEMVFDPPWTPADITPEGRARL